MPSARPAAPTQLEAVLTRLRETIMRGGFEANARLEEKQLAELLGVSRTPVRIAMQSLAQEGLLVYNPHRGFQVRAFSRQEVIDAIDVRGRLEAFGCELLAARGVSEAQAQRIHANLHETGALLHKGTHGAADVDAWARLNAAFHHLLLEPCGNALIERMIGQMHAIPMASAGVIPTTTDNVDQVFAYVGDALGMHVLVFDAIQRRQPSRAHSLMLEHIYQGRERILQVLQRGPEATATDAGTGWHRIALTATPISDKPSRRRAPTAKRTPAKAKDPPSDVD
ncbi:MAG: GntR family transcriptional regulator [Burkholderiaceae bacterium]